MILFRKLITFVICFMLVNINLTFDREQIKANISYSQAYAQTDTTNSEDAPRGETGKIDLEEEKGNFLTGGVGSIVILLAAAFFVSKLYISYDSEKGAKPKDVTAAAIAGGIFIAAELYSAFTTNEELKKKTIEYKTRTEDGSIDEGQIAALVKEKEVMESIASAAESKAQFQKAVAAGFGIAAGIGTYLLMQQLSKLAKCTASLASTVTAGSTMVASLNAYYMSAATTKTPITVKAEENLVVCSSLSAKLTKKETLDTIPEVSISSYAKVVTLLQGMTDDLVTCTMAYELVELDFKTIDPICATHVSNPATSSSLGAACTKAMKPAKTSHASYSAAATKTAALCKEYVAFHTLTHGKVDIIEGTSTKKSNDILNNIFPILGLFISNAIAGNSMTKGIAGLVGVIGAHYLDIKTVIDTFMTSPGKRTIVWTGLAAYALAVSKQTEKEAETARENAAKLQKLINRMENSKVNPSIAKAQAKKVNVSRVTLGGFSPLELGEPLTCTTGTPVKGADGNSTCPPLPSKVTTTKNSALSNLPGVLSDGFSNLANIGNNMQGSGVISPRTQQGIVNLGGKQAAISKTNKRLRNNLEKLKKLAGVKTKSDQARVKGLMDSLVASVSKGKKGSQGFGGVALFPNSLPDSATKSDEEKVKAGEGTKVSKTMKGSSAVVSKGKKGTFDFEFVDDKRKEEFAQNAEAVNKLNEEEEAKDDIVMDKGVSIFKVISNRYLRSGYKRLLDEL